MAIASMIRINVRFLLTLHPNVQFTDHGLFAAAELGADAAGGGSCNGFVVPAKK